MDVTLWRICKQARYDFPPRHHVNTFSLKSCATSSASSSSDVAIKASRGTAYHDAANLQADALSISAETLRAYLLAEVFRHQKRI